MSDRDLRYEELLACLQALERENAELRGRLGMRIPTPRETDLPSVENKSVEQPRTPAEHDAEPSERVVFRPGFHQKFTVIDGTISWYGSVNILSFGKSEESVMRLESREIAGELIDTVIKDASESEHDGRR